MNMETPKKRGRPAKIQPPSTEKKYSPETTDFDQVALWTQLFTNIFDRNRDKSIGQVLDYIVENGGYALSNHDLIELTNKIGMRTEMRTPAPQEDNITE